MPDDKLTQAIEALDRLTTSLAPDALTYIKETVQAAQRDISVHVEGDVSGPLSVSSRIFELNAIISRYDLDDEARRTLRALIADLRKKIGHLSDGEELPRLFVSYAHADDPAFVERLVGDLVKAGFAVWWDRAHLPSRGISLPQEVRDAILTQIDRLVAVIGSEAARKGTTEGTTIHLEWTTARKHCKVINAVLRGGSPDLLPEDWRGPLYFDFNGDALYETRRDEMIAKLKIAESPPGRLVNVPDLPAHFLDRPADIQVVKGMLLGDPGRPVVVSGQQKKVNLRGMGGIGKSVTAQTLAFDCDVRRAFTDGVYWVRVGDKPSLLSRLADLIESIGGFRPDVKDEETGKTKLSELLAGRACLIILDDVWEKEHVRAFDVLGPRCRMLVTSRIAGLVEGAPEHRVSALSREQSTEMLRSWAGHEDPHLVEIADHLGGLPLALKLAGAQLEKGMVVDEWLARYDRVSRMKASHNAKGRDENLQACFDVSVEAFAKDGDDPLLYHLLGIFQEDAWVPEHVVIQLWQQAKSNLDAVERLEIIEELERLSLIERDRSNHTISLHDLLHDYNTEQLGDAFSQYQSMLLTSYNPNGRPWYEIEHDGYLYYSLAYHLQSAKRNSELNNLLIDSPDWMNAKFTSTVGDASYAADLEIALQELSDPPSTDDLLTAIQLHTARQVVHARTSVYTDYDLGTLLMVGQRQEALTYARLRANYSDKFDGLFTLLKSLIDAEGHDCILVDEALDTARKITDTWKRANALASITEILIRIDDERASEVFDEAFKEARSSRNTIPEFSMKNLAEAVAKAGSTERARRVVEELVGQDREDALENVAKHLAQGGYIDSALEIIREIHDERNQTLSVMESVMLALVRAGRVQEVADLIRSTENEINHLFVFRNIVEQLTLQGEIDRAFEVAYSPGEHTNTADLLLTIARASTQNNQSVTKRACSEALHTVDSIDDSIKKANLLLLISETLMTIKSEQGQAVDALRVVYRIVFSSESIPFHIARRLAIDFAQLGLSSEAADTARHIRETQKRVQTLQDVIGTLVQIGDIESALATIKQIESTEGRILPLLLIAEALVNTDDDRSPQVLKKALASFLGLKNTPLRLYLSPLVIRILLKIGDGQAETRLAETLNHIASFEDASKRVQALLRIADTLYETNSEKALAMMAEASKELIKIENESEREYWARELAELYIQAGQPENTVQVIRSIWDSHRGDSLLIELSVKLAEEGQIQRAVALISSLVDAEKRREVMRSIAQKLLQTNDSQIILTTVRSIEESELRAEALRIIARHFAEIGSPQAHDILEEALVAGRSVGNLEERAFALQAIATVLIKSRIAGAEKLLQEAIQIGRSITEPVERAFVLTVVAQVLFTMDISQADELLREISDTLNECGQSFFNIDMVRTRLAVLQAQANHIQDALNTIDSMTPAGSRSAAIRLTIKTLVESGRIEDALRLPDTIQNVSDKVSILGSLATYLYEAKDSRAISILNSAFDEGSLIQKGYAWVNALRPAIDILIQVDDDRIRSIIDEALSIAANDDNAEICIEMLELAIFALVKLGEKQRVSVLLGDVIEVSKNVTNIYSRPPVLQAASKALAHCGMVNDATEMALSIEDTWFRQSTLQMLAYMQVQSGNWNSALRILGSQTLDNFLQIVALWLPATMKPVPTLREATRIAGWVRPDWQEVYQYLTMA